MERKGAAVRFNNWCGLISGADVINYSHFWIKLNFKKSLCSRSRAENTFETNLFQLRVEAVKTRPNIKLDAIIFNES